MNEQYGKKFALEKGEVESRTGQKAEWFEGKCDFERKTVLICDRAIQVPSAPADRLKRRANFQKV
jgi:hypothetical protein